jgi:hypothetical protein
LIGYDDWKDNFSTLFINIDFPEDWTGVRFKSKWTKSNAMGLPAKNEPEALEKFARNPQFMIKPVEDTEIMFSLTQVGGRLPINGKYFNYPFSETLRYNNVSVWKLNEGETHLKSFDKDRIVFISPIRSEEENCGRLVLKGG